MLVAACAPADVSGTYTGALTNRDNGCMFMNYTAGDTTSGITMVVTQSGGSVSLDVQGIAGIFLAAITGSGAPLVGSVAGNGFVASKNGTAGQTVDGCAFTTDVEARGALNGNALEGTVTYRYRTNNAASCGFRSSCTTVQQFAFTRPPR